MDQLHILWAIVKKDIAIWLRSPAVMAVTLLPAIALMLLLVLQAAAVQGSPVAIVNLDKSGRAAMQLENVTTHYGGFYSATVMNSTEANHAFQQLSVSAILTIPKAFSYDLSIGKTPNLTWQVRNFNEDTANDLRRALPDLLSQFEKSYSTSSKLPVITIHEQDLHAKDATFIGFNLVAVIVMLVLQAGVVNAGLASVREWESGSIKELLMSPSTALTLITGKVIAGVVASDAVAMIAMGLAMIAGIIAVPSITLALWALLLTTFAGVFGAGIGVFLGTVFRNMERVSVLSVMLSFYLFFLAGGITDIAYFPGWLQTIASFVPNSYAMGGLRSALLYGSAVGMGTDALALLLAAVVGLVIGVPALRRGLSH